MSLTDLLALVDVEQLDQLQQRSSTFDEGLPGVLAGDGLINDKSDVLLGHREARDRLDLATTRCSGHQGVKVELNGTGSLRQTSTRHHGRVQLARVTDDLAAHDESGAPAGMPRSLPVRRTLQRDADGVSGLLSHQHRMTPIRLDGLAVPAIRQPISADDRSQHARLGWQSGVDLSENLVGGTLVDTRTWRPGRDHGAEDRTALEDREIFLGPRHVRRHGVEKSRQQAGAQIGVSVVKRIGQLHRRMTRVIGTDPEGFEILVAHERQGDELDESGLDDRTPRLGGRASSMRSKPILRPISST